MSVHFGNEPPGSRTALEDGLKALDAGPTSAAESHLAAVKGGQAPPPLPVYSLRLDDIITGMQSPSGDPVAWTFLIIASGQPVRTAEVLPNPPGSQNQFVFASISSASAPAIAQVIATADADTTLASGQYELRLVQIPALYVSALWLKALGGTTDYYVIIPPAARGFVAHVVISSSDFYRDLLSLARQKRAATPQQNPASPTN